MPGPSGKPAPDAARAERDSLETPVPDPHPAHIPGTPHVDEATTRLLADRYGTERDPARRRRGVIAAIAALVVLLIAYALATGLLSGRNDVHVEHVGYEVVDPTEAVVRFNLTANEGDSLTCTLTAVSEHFTEVGFVELPVGPLEHDTVFVEARIPTVEQAASATIDGCRRN